MKSKLILPLLWALVVFTPGRVFAQTAQLSGVVADSSEGRVPNSSLTVTNENTGSKRTTTTNIEGFYAFPDLEPGKYSVLVEAAGFQPERQTGILLEVAQNARLDFTLKVGDTKQAITVTATVTAEKKGEERLLDTPVPVTVLNAISLAEHDEVSLREYAAQVPGLSVIPSYEGNQYISIRGIHSGGTQNPTVGITVDDVPFGFSLSLGQN